jgi:exopolyphosphatase/pppGpp-phosphohydrolase
MDSLRGAAAIDIGSDAVRLLLSEVFETDTGPYFRKNLVDSDADPVGRGCVYQR